MSGRYVPMEELDVYRRACALSDQIYRLVAEMPIFARQTLGPQLVRAIDSVGANLVEGDVRGSDIDASRFFRYARGSAREARYFIERTFARGLIDQSTRDEWCAEIVEIAKMINGLLGHRGMGARVKESSAIYDQEQDPFTA